MATVTVTPIDDDSGGVGDRSSRSRTCEGPSRGGRAAESDQRLRLAHAAAELGRRHWNAADGTNVWDAQLHHIYGLPPGGFDGTWDAWVDTVHPTTCPR